MARSSSRVPQRMWMPLATSGSPELRAHCPTALWTRGHVARSAAGWPHRTQPRASARTFHAKRAQHGGASKSLSERVFLKLVVGSVPLECAKSDPPSCLEDVDVDDGRPAGHGRGRGRIAITSTSGLGESCSTMVRYAREAHRGDPRTRKPAPAHTRRTCHRMCVTTCHRPRLAVSFGPPLTDLS